MEYGLTFVVDMYDFERNEELHVLTLPGDYIRMSTWAEQNLTERVSDTVDSLRHNYAIAWFALDRRGKTAELGLPEKLDADGVDAMADRFSIYVNDVDGSSLPLAQERG